MPQPPASPAWSRLASFEDSHAATSAQATSSGYVAVPLTHRLHTSPLPSSPYHNAATHNTTAATVLGRQQQQHDVTTASNSNALLVARTLNLQERGGNTSPPPPSCVIDERARRWREAGVNIDAILGISSSSDSGGGGAGVGGSTSSSNHGPGEHQGPAAPVGKTSIAPSPSTAAVNHTAYASSPIPTSPSSAAAHHHLVALSRSINAARQERQFEPTVASSGRGGRGGGRGGPPWARGGFYGKKKADNANDGGSRKRTRADNADDEDDESAEFGDGGPLRVPVVPASSTSSAVATTNKPLHSTKDGTSAASGGGSKKRASSSTAASTSTTPQVFLAPHAAAAAPQRTMLFSGGGGNQESTRVNHAVASSSHHLLPATVKRTSGLACGGWDSAITPSASSSASLLPDVDGNPLHDDVVQPSSVVTEIVAEIDQDLSDPDRIQAPLLGLVILTTDGHNSFSLSANMDAGGGGGSATGSKATSSSAAVHLSMTNSVCVAQRTSVLNLTDGSLVSWRGELSRLTRDETVALLYALDRNGARSDVDVVVWGTSSVLLPYMAAKYTEPSQRCAVCPLYPLDLRVMSWMLDPADPCADFDAVHMRTVPSSRLSQHGMNTLDGACDRLAQMMLLYRRLYATMGAKGLLQPFLKQERQTAVLCCLMKFEGFLVDVSQLQALKSQAHQELSALQVEAERILAPHGMQTINLQSPEECREALYGILQLDQHLHGDTHDDVGAAAAAPSSSTATLTTKGGKMSTAEDVLRRLAVHHRLPQLILDHRKLAKVLQTYLEGVFEDTAVTLDETRFAKELGHKSIHDLSMNEFLMAADDDEEDDDLKCGGGRRSSSFGLLTSKVRDGSLRRVHATFLQCSTDTGRLSCVDPNLQNLPRASTAATATASPSAAATRLSGAVRCSFVPQPGCVLVAFDYEQIELRVLAHMSGDAMLIDALGGGVGGLPFVPAANSRPSNATAAAITSSSVDIHRKIAAVIFRKSDPSLVTSTERTIAKRVVFGVLYGMGPRALASQINESLERAQEVMQAFRHGFPFLDRYTARIIAQCKQENGVVRTLCGRTRTLPDVLDMNGTKRSQAERQAFNTVIQGSAADIMKRAMIAVYEDVLQHPSYNGLVRLHCQVHDELVLSIPTAMVPSVVDAVRTCMTSCVALLVPLRVAVQVGSSYGAMQPMSPSVSA